VATVSIDLTDRRIGFLVANEGVERVELTDPWQAVLDAGGTAVLVAPHEGDVQTFDHLDKAEVLQADVALLNAGGEEFHGWVLPGGVANPDHLRTDARAVQVVQHALDTGVPVAAICHAAWTIVEADRVRDRRLTSWPSLRTDIANAGGEWVDEEVVVDGSGAGPLITSRNPGDLPAFCEAMLEAFARQPVGGV
jgi:protease I